MKTNSRTKIIFFEHDQSSGWERLYTLALKLFSGSRIKHVGYLDVKSQMFHEMKETFVSVPWGPRLAEALRDGDKIRIVDAPEYISPETTNALHIAAGNGIQYGVVDYILFAIRPIYRLIGKPVRNYGGWICSEIVYIALRIEGWAKTYVSVPSPGDLYRTLMNEGQHEETVNCG